MVEGLYALDGEGRLTFMNSAASRMLGWTEDELRGEDRCTPPSISSMRTDRRTRARIASCCKVRIEGRPVRMAHDAFTCKDGTICPVAYSAAPLMDGHDDRAVSSSCFATRVRSNAEEDRARRELDSLAWVGRIRDALDEDRLVLYSQPIVPLAGGQPSQELLLRMIGRAARSSRPGASFRWLRSTG